MKRCLPSHTPQQAQPQQTTIYSISIPKNCTINIHHHSQVRVLRVGLTFAANIYKTKNSYNLQLFETGDSAEADIWRRGGGGGGGDGEKRPAATRSSIAPLANINESKRCRGAAAQRSSTHRRLCSAPRVLARVSIRREAAAGGFPESLQPQPPLCSPCIGRDEKSRYL